MSGRIRSRTILVAVLGLILSTLMGSGQFQTGLLFNNSIHPSLIGEAYPWHPSESCMFNLFGLISFGDSSVFSAMKKGKHSRAALVEIRKQGALGVYRYCTIVYGPLGDVGAPEE